MAKEEKTKAPKQTAEEKKAAKAKHKEKVQIQKEWEDSIVSSKRVKREEFRRKFKRAMLFLLVFSLIITSVVYIMLLFIDENNVRITASSSSKSKTISLSMDNEVWSPYLTGKGPNSMDDITYWLSDGYLEEDKLGISVDEIRDFLLNTEDFEPGTKSFENYIAFAFLLRNDGAEDCSLDCEMTLEYDANRNLQDCVRVMWGTSFKNHPENTNVDIYASLSHDERLYGTIINYDRNHETGYIEYVAYPVGSDNPSFSMRDYEEDLLNSEDYYDVVIGGYYATVPFYDDEHVFKYGELFEAGDVMYCYVIIWLEGSDFECVDSAIGGYVKLNINFNAY